MSLSVRARSFTYEPGSLSASPLGAPFHRSPMRARAQLAGGRVLTPDGWLDADIAVCEGRISSVDMGRRVSTDDGETDVLDVSGYRVVPGFVDLQVNGGWGIDFASNPAGIWEVGRRLASTGVTAWLPTLITSPEEKWQEALAALANRPAGWTGAEPLGWHFEGPWLNPKRKGAHREEFLCTPRLPLDPLLDSSGGLALVTLAPELEGCLEASKVLRERGVIVSLGHSDASLAEATAGLSAGATMGTHLYNAMSGLSHREPGLAAALLTSDAFFGFIADGIHSAPAMVDLAWRSGRGRLVLVTDMMAGLGLTPGVVKLGDYEVHLDGTSARLADGTLAGSVLDMPTAIRNLREFTDCSLEEAVQAASRAPASVLAGSPVMHGRARGQLVRGGRADLVVIDDDLNVVATMIDGRIVHQDRKKLQ